MRQYKTIAQIRVLLLLSILNVVFAAPVVPLEVRDTDNDVVAVAEDAIIVSETRRGIPPDGTTPSQYSSPLSDGSPPHDSLPLEEPEPSQGSAQVGACARSNNGGINSSELYRDNARHVVQGSSTCFHGEKNRGFCSHRWRRHRYCANVSVAS